MFNYDLGKRIINKSGEISNSKFKKYITDTLMECGYLLDLESINNEYNISGNVLKYNNSLESKVNNIFNNKKYYFTDFSNNVKPNGYLILSTINNKHAMIWISSVIYMVTPIPYIFTDDLYEKTTIFKCNRNIDTITIFDIYCYRGDITSSILSERLEILKKIEFLTKFDYEHTYISFYGLVFKKYEQLKIDKNTKNNKKNKITKNKIYIPDNDGEIIIIT